MIVDPWGVVLAQAPDTECFVAAELDLAVLEEMRYSLPSLTNRRPQAYRWPDENLKRRAGDLEEPPQRPAMAPGPTPGGV
jgi:hypothetical protein